MNKFQAMVGKEFLGLEPDEMEKVVEFADKNGIWLDWSEADEQDFKEWFATVMLEASQLEQVRALSHQEAK